MQERHLQCRLTRLFHVFSHIMASYWSLLASTPLALVAWKNEEHNDKISVPAPVVPLAQWTIR